MERIQIEIYGQTYSMKGGANGDHVRALAAFVDSKMREIEKGTGTVDPLRVAILAALTISDELYAAKGQQADLEQSVDTMLARLIAQTERS